MNQKDRFELMRKLKNSWVFDETGKPIGFASDILPEAVKIYFSHIQYSDEFGRGTMWVECPICGMRGMNLEHHEHKFDGQVTTSGTITFKCIKCGKEETIRRPTYNHRIETGKIGLCTECIVKMQNLEKWGHENYMKSEHFLKTREQTWMAKYRVDNPFKLQEIQDKCKETWKQNLGVDNPFKLKEIQEKRKKTWEETLGVDNPSKAKEIKDKKIKHFLEVFGVDNPRKADYVKAKIAKSSLDHFRKVYGVDSAWHLEFVQEKAKQTSLKRYGATHAFAAPEIRAKFLQQWKESYEKTCLERYGVPHVLSAGSPIRKKSAKSRSFPKTEKRLLEFLKNRNIPFIHRFLLCSHEFDVAILNENGAVIALVDVDGSYYHNWLSEANGFNLPVTYEYDALRPTYCGDLKFIAIHDKDFENGLKEILKVLDQNYDEYLQSIFDWCRKIGIPYPNYPNQILMKSWFDLCKIQKISFHGQIGYKLIRQFHKSIWHAKKEGYEYSPIEAYLDDTLLWKAIKNRFIYANTLDPACVLDAFTIAKIAPRVSVFQPSTAKKLVMQYLNQYKQIFDPFSGYSGRMLGAIASGKEYVGQDCNPTTIHESEVLAKFLDIHPILSVQDSAKTIGKYECLFTCPPYNLKENWGQEIENHSCDEWIDICLKNYDCQAYLFVVDKTDKYKEFVVETINNNSHLVKSSEQVVLIHKSDLQ